MRSIRFSSLTLENMSVPSAIKKLSPNEQRPSQTNKAKEKIIFEVIVADESHQKLHQIENPVVKRFELERVPFKDFIEAVAAKAKIKVEQIRKITATKSQILLEDDSDLELLYRIYSQAKTALIVRLKVETIFI